MGFKDEDISTPKHDEIVSFVSKEENLLKILKKIKYGSFSIESIEIEKPISDKYHSYGFLDVFFLFNNLDAHYFGFIEVKSTKSTFTKEIREIEYYKDKLQNNDLNLKNRDYLRKDLTPILISPTEIPDQFSKQVNHFTFEEILEICK